MFRRIIQDYVCVRERHRTHCGKRDRVSSSWDQTADENLDQNQTVGKGNQDSDFNMSITLGENRSSTIAILDSFGQFVKIFTYAIYLKDLHIFTCHHCGEKYLAVTDMRYCKGKECQQEKEKEQRRTKRQNRKYDPYVQPLDNFNDYARGRLREMRLAGATQKEVAAYEELKLRHRDDLRIRLDAFKNQGETPDEEFYQICDGYKKELKTRSDVVINRNRKKA